MKTTNINDIEIETHSNDVVKASALICQTFDSHKIPQSAGILALVRVLAHSIVIDGLRKEAILQALDHYIIAITKRSCPDDNV